MFHGARSGERELTSAPGRGHSDSIGAFRGPLALKRKSYRATRWAGGDPHKAGAETRARRKAPISQLQFEQFRHAQQRRTSRLTIDCQYMQSRIPANTFGPPHPVIPLSGGLEAPASPPVVDGRDRSVRLCSLDPRHPQAASRSGRARKRTPRRSLRLRTFQRLRQALRQDLGSIHSTRALGRIRQPAEPLGLWRTQRQTGAARHHDPRPSSTQMIRPSFG